MLQQANMEMLHSLLLFYALTGQHNLKVMAATAKQSGAEGLLISRELLCYRAPHKS